MQTIAPTHSATGPYAPPGPPSATKIGQVRISVAIVMPETGFDDDPMRPTMRDETVTKKKPKRITRTETRRLPWVGIFGGAAGKRTIKTRRTSRPRHPEPRQHAARKHHAGDSRTDDIADAQVLRRDV